MGNRDSSIIPPIEEEKDTAVTVKDMIETLKTLDQNAVIALDYNDSDNPNDWSTYDNIEEFKKSIYISKHGRISDPVNSYVVLGRETF